MSRKQHTGYVDAICPTCKEIIRRESVPGRDAETIRGLMQQVVEAFKRLYPFAKVKTFDPLAKGN